MNATRGLDVPAGLYLHTSDSLMWGRGTESKLRHFCTRDGHQMKPACAL